MQKFNVTCNDMIVKNETGKPMIYNDISSAANAMHQLKKLKANKGKRFYISRTHDEDNCAATSMSAKYWGRKQCRWSTDTNKNVPIG